MRLSKWFTTLSPKEKTKIVKDVTQLVLSRRAKMCNFLEYKGTPKSLSHANDIRFQSCISEVVLKMWKLANEDMRHSSLSQESNRTIMN